MAKMKPERCGATIRPEGGKAVFVCDRPEGHDGPHSGSTFWGKGLLKWEGR